MSDGILRKAAQRVIDGIIPGETNELEFVISMNALRAALADTSDVPMGTITAKMLAKALWETNTSRSSDQPEKFDELDEQMQRWLCSSAQVVLDALDGQQYAENVERGSAAVRAAIIDYDAHQKK